jgi:hypothetical protein
MKCPVEISGNPLLCSHNGSDNQGGQHLNLLKVEPSNHFSQQHDENDRAEPDVERIEIHGAALGQREPEAIENMLMPIPSLMQPEKISDLPHRDEKAGSRHETDDDRLGNVARQVPNRNTSTRNIKSVNFIFDLFLVSPLKKTTVT